MGWLIFLLDQTQHFLIDVGIVGDLYDPGTLLHNICFFQSSSGLNIITYCLPLFGFNHHVLATLIENALDLLFGLELPYFLNGLSCWKLKFMRQIL